MQWVRQQTRPTLRTATEKRRQTARFQFLSHIQSDCCPMATRAADRTIAASFPSWTIPFKRARREAEPSPLARILPATTHALRRHMSSDARVMAVPAMASTRSSAVQSSTFSTSNTSARGAYSICVDADRVFCVSPLCGQTCWQISHPNNQSSVADANVAGTSSRSSIVKAAMHRLASSFQGDRASVGQASMHRVQVPQGSS